MSSEERVLCVPANLLRQWSVNNAYGPEGNFAKLVIRDSDDAWDHLHGFDDLGSWIMRKNCEYDPSWKQIIPYIVISCQGRVFTYERGSGGGEKRLDAMLSMGIGGHINHEDAGSSTATLRRLVERGMWREFTEEVRLLVPPSRTRLVGVVNDDSTEVGKHHAGFVYECEIAFPDFDVAEKTSIANGRFVTPEQLATDFARCESWTQVLLSNLFLIGG